MLRWAVPAGALVAVGVVGSGMLSAASVSSELPARSANDLLADLETVHVAGFSGTVVENASLGLPELPSFGLTSGNATSITDLLAGSHTMRVWFAGLTKQRLALIGTVGETDIFHDGSNLWIWNSDSQSATHTSLPPEVAGQPVTPTQTQLPTLTPSDLTAKALALVGPLTTLSTDGQRRIANRDAYQLVLSPKAATSRVGSVKVTIDAKTKLPLGVQVFARSDPTLPALDVSFTHVDLSVPTDANFDFTPPRTVTVKEQKLGDVPGASAATDVAKELSVLGAGWTSVVELPNGNLLGLPAPGTAKPTGAAGLASSLFDALTTVHGSWGSGHLLDSTLLTVLVSDNGRVYLGAVDPQVLYAAAASGK